MCTRHLGAMEEALNAHHSGPGGTSLQTPVCATHEGRWLGSIRPKVAGLAMLDAGKTHTDCCRCQAEHRPSGVSPRLETPCKTHLTNMAAGAGQGIGRAFAHALGEAGASVAIVDVNKAKADPVAQELNSKGVRSVSVGADITKKADCQR